MNFQKTKMSLGLFVKIKVSGPQKSVKIDTNYEEEPKQNCKSIFNASWKPTWRPKPSQNPSKIDEKSMKIGHQKR